MGDPVSVQVEGRKIWTCCAACPPKLKAEPTRYLARLVPPPRDQVLSIPESAVIDTGTRKIVYVETEPGVYEGHEVVLGPRSGDRFGVLEGLAPGEKIATAGAFLIDAESRLNPSTAATQSKHVVHKPVAISSEADTNGNPAQHRH
jgi:Cu(I)/Ag(I) efflux system membrane fusion protein